MASPEEAPSRSPAQDPASPPDGDAEQTADAERKVPAEGAEFEVPEEEKQDGADKTEEEAMALDDDAVAAVTGQEENFDDVDYYGGGAMLDAPGEGDATGEDPANNDEDNGDAATDEQGRVLCYICGVGIALLLKNRYGKCCSALIAAARRDTKQQGAEAQKAFSRLKKMGTNEFRTCILEYKARCFQHKGFRRPNFQWCRYLMIIELSSSRDIGGKSVWLCEFAFCKFLGNTRGLSMAAGRQKFMIEKQRLPEGRQRTVDGEVELLWPIEEFVMNYESRKVREECQLGGKAISKF